MSKDETKGWICPKCGRVYAPWVNKCQYCGNSTTITYTPPTCPYWYCSRPYDWTVTTSATTASNTYANINGATTTTSSSNTVKC